MGPLLHCVASLGYPVSLSVLASVSGGNVQLCTKMIRQNLVTFKLTHKT